MKPPSLITVCRTFLSFSFLVLYVGFLLGKLNPLTINHTENSHEVISHLPLWAGSKHQNTFVMYEEKTDTKLIRFIAQIWDPGQTRLSLNNKTCVSSKNETKCDGTGGQRSHFSNLCLFVAYKNIELPVRSVFPMEEDRSSALTG